MATGDRKDPFRSFNFRVEIDGIQVGSFSDVSGLSSDGKGLVPTGAAAIIRSSAAPEFVFSPESRNACRCSALGFSDNFLTAVSTPRRACPRNCSADCPEYIPICGSL